MKITKQERAEEQRALCANLFKAHVLVALHEAVLTSGKPLGLVAEELGWDLDDVDEVLLRGRGSVRQTAELAWACGFRIGIQMLRNPAFDPDAPAA